MRYFISVWFSFIVCVSFAQVQLTPYDAVPGNIASYKPNYSAEFPQWAKMLYQQEINFHEISKAYRLWEADNPNDHSAINRYYKIWSKQILPWVYAQGTIILPDEYEYQKNLIQSQKRTQVINKKGGNGSWTFLGPKETFWLNESGPAFNQRSAPWQVNVYSFDVAMSNQDILYCGTETGYVNKSIDKGNHWSQVGLAYNFGGGVTEVAIDPVDADIVYVSAGNQMHKTEDGGMSWMPMLSAGNTFAADRMEIDSDNRNKLYAAANNGLYVSLDAGVTWERKYNSRTYDVHRHPTNPNIVYGLTQQNNDFVLVVSNDGGNTFELDNSFPKNIRNESGGLLAVSQDNPEAVYCILLSSNEKPFLYQGNINNGQWVLLAEGNTNQLGMNNWQGYFDLVLEVSDENADIIFTGTGTLYGSLNGGISFQNIGGYGGRFEIHPDIQDMKILNGGEVWVSTDGGMNYSNDFFSTHHEAKINGIIGSDMWGFDQSWNEDLVVGGRYHNGNTAIADFYGDKALRMGGAESPTGWVRQGRSRHVAFDDLGQGWILPKSADAEAEGRFIFAKYPNMDEYGGRRSNMIFHPNYSGHIYLGEGNGLWESTDGGMQYTLIHDFNNRVRWLQGAYSDANVMYADIQNRGLFKSEDRGITWVHKPAITSDAVGGINWAGALFIAISPTDANTIYACLQNGTWSSNIGRIYKSVDGGDSWENWTEDLSVYTKSLVVQPDKDGNDLVYLFTNARDQSAKVYLRKEGSNVWEDCSDGFPAGFHVNLALPFYRDSKLRVSGNAGVWEYPLEDASYSPIISPWVEKAAYACVHDSVYFEDHSIIDHKDCSWRWEIFPDPEFISDPNIRNPVVVLGNEGSYDVTMYVTKDGVEYSKFIPDMIRTTSCPSINDCSNPDDIPKSDWNLVSTDSEEAVYPGLASMAFDDDPETIWHTRWTSGNDTYPHEIVIDMGQNYLTNSFTYLPRQDGGVNGRVKDYQLFLSENTSDWGDAVSEGAFENTSAPSIINFEERVLCRYIKLVCLSEVNGNIWSSASELSMTGCTESAVSTVDHQWKNKAKAFPVPTDGKVFVDLPNSGDYAFTMYDVSGQLINSGQMELNRSNRYSVDLSSSPKGVYFMNILSERGVTYYVKVIKGG